MPKTHIVLEPKDDTWGIAELGRDKRGRLSVKDTPWDRKAKMQADPMSASPSKRRRTDSASPTKRGAPDQMNSGPGGSDLLDMTHDINDHFDETFPVSTVTQFGEYD